MKGFSTLELLIAMALLALTLGGVVLLTFGNQSLFSDTEVASEALAKTQAMLEESQTLSRKDFRLVNPAPPVTDGAYTKTLDVEAQPDWFTKKITATVTWTGEHFRSQRTVLSTIVSNFENPIGADTCSSVLEGDWSNPSKSTFNFANLAGTPGAEYDISDVDASIDSSAATNRDRLYVSVNATPGNPSAKTFFTFDISNPTNPTLVSGRSLDTDSSSGEGVNAIQVAGRYAYAASARSANFNTVTPDVPCDNASGANPSCGQLYVIDLGVAPNPAQIIYTLQVPSVSGKGGQGIGQSLFYKDGYLYLGLAKTGSGPEFNIIDVHNPTAPFWLSGVDIGAQVNSILVRSTADGTFAFLATPNGVLGGGNEEISVINVTNPALPSYVGGFAGFDNSANGKSLYAIGDHLFAGETVSTSHPELYRFDISTPLSFVAKNPSPYTYDATARPNAFSKEIGASVNGLVVRDFLAFLVTGPSGELQTYNISDPSNVTQYASPKSLYGTGAALDCEGNHLYAASNSGAPNPGYLYVIAP